MKRSTFFIAIGILVAAICVQQASLVIIDILHPEPLVTIHDSEVRVTHEPVEEIRESITFILGEDKEEDNLYYKEATLYYSNHPGGMTTYLVTKCRSLLEVRDYLEMNRAGNGLPWGLINLVSHGNQWSGLSVKVTPDSKRSTAERIMEYIRNKTFRPLKADVIDGETEIFLRGCGIGNNHALVENLALAFGGEYNKPLTRASKMFEYYASVSSDSSVESERYLTHPWFISYKMDEKPAISSLMNELREKYPHAPIDWQRALATKKPRSTGDVYHDTFEVPVKWIIPNDDDSLPDLSSEADQLAWLQSQNQIAGELERLQIPLRKFSWSFQQVYVDNPDGTKSPAIWVKGYCTMLCVLKALTGVYDESLILQKPFVVRYDNPGFYYTVRSNSNISYNK